MTRDTLHLDPDIHVAFPSFHRSARRKSFARFFCCSSDRGLRRRGIEFRLGWKSALLTQLGKIHKLQGRTVLTRNWQVE